MRARPGFGGGLVHGQCRRDGSFVRSHSCAAPVRAAKSGRREDHCAVHLCRAIESRDGLAPGWSGFPVSSAGTRLSQTAVCQAKRPTRSRRRPRSRLSVGRVCERNGARRQGACDLRPWAPLGRGGGPVEPRMISSVGSHTGGGAGSPRSRPSRSSPARRPFSMWGWRTVVSVGFVVCARGVSSNPITDSKGAVVSRAHRSPPEARRHCPHVLRTLR
jgi:hypothetical protein